MAFPSPVNYSNGQIDRAGRALVTEERPFPESWFDSLNIVNSWRAAHAYPMNTFTTTLRRKTRRYRGAIIAQRLKRLPTITNKLRRFDDMRLSRMQDVGGARAILATVKDVRRLEADYLKPGRYSHIIKRHNDYINEPKHDGYRGVHLAFEYHSRSRRNLKAIAYDGLVIEVQIRTSLQHTWGTAVESYGTFSGDALKNGIGNEDWKEFFALCSSAFAFVEGCPPCPQHAHLNALEVYRKISAMNRKLHAIDFLRGMTAATNIINRSLRGEDVARRDHAFYNVISLDIDKKELTIYGFKRQDFARATKKYEELEKREGNFDRVLVSVNSLKSLKDAYPNYFLDIKEFTDRIKYILEALPVNEV